MNMKCLLLSLAFLALSLAKPLYLLDSQQNSTSHEEDYSDASNGTTLAPVDSHESTLVTVEPLNTTLEAEAPKIDEDELKKIMENFPDKDPEEMLEIKEILKNLTVTMSERLQPLELDVTIDSLEVTPVNVSVVIPHASIPEINEALAEYLHQGDIIENKAHLQSGRAKRNTINALKDRELAWETDKPIPYKIDSKVAPVGVQAIHDALKFWSDNTCLSFAENGSAKGTTLMHFINGGGCYSSVGKQHEAKMQSVSIGGGCLYFGIAAHEIGHALGMWHSQSRTDRDEYVNVITSNIAPNLMYNYDKETDATNFNHKVRYDYGSIMHYEPSSFAIDRKQPTLVAKDPGYQKTMGQRVVPAFSDVWLVNLQHNCTDRCAESKIECQNGGYPDPRNCSRCKCPDSFVGTLCDSRDPGDDPENCGETLNATAEWQSLNGSIGKDVWENIPEMKCYYHINAPEGKKLRFRLNSIGNICTTNCFYGAVEIKVDDPRYYGYRFCCPEDAKGQSYDSKTGQIVIVMRSVFQRQEFALDYKYV